MAKAEQGIVWVSSNGVYYENPKIDYETIKDYIRNIYGADLTQKLKNLIFPEKCLIEVIDKNGEPDSALSERLTTMCEQPAVKLWLKLQTVFMDIAWWGPALLNPVWGWKGNEYWLFKLRRLPPESFYQAPPGVQFVYSHILQGIILDPKTQEPRFYQTDIAIDAGNPKEITNVFMITDQTTGELAGRPHFLPIIPLIGMLNFCWTAQMQKINRVGAPPMMIKVIGGDQDDIDFAQKILNNWGKDFNYQLRENMELVDISIVDSDTALATIEALSKIISSFGSPSNMIAKDGTLIGGSSAAELELLNNYIRGWHILLCENSEKLLQPYLDANGYNDFRVKITIPTPGADKADLWIRQAAEGREAGVLTFNEIRDLLECDEIDDEMREEILKEYVDKRRQERATWISTIMNANSLDPFWMFTPDEARNLMELEGKAPELVTRPPPTINIGEENVQEQEEGEKEAVEGEEGIEQNVEQ